MSKKIALGLGITLLAVSIGGVAIAKNHKKYCFHGKHHAHSHHGMKKHKLNIMRHADVDKDGNITSVED